jgi:hypothetical protein
VGVEELQDTHVHSHQGVSGYHVLYDSAEGPGEQPHERQSGGQGETVGAPRREAPPQPEAGPTLEETLYALPSKPLEGAPEPLGVVCSPTVEQVEDHSKGGKNSEQEARLPQPLFDDPEATAQQIADQDRRRGPHSSPKRVVEEEGSEAHAA